MGTLNESANTSFFDGREFSSFQEPNHDISKYEKRFFVNLYVRSSRSIESAKRRAPNKAFSEDLKFSEFPDHNATKNAKKRTAKRCWFDSHRASQKENDYRCNTIPQKVAYRKGKR